MMNKTKDLGGLVQFRSKQLNSVHLNSVQVRSKNPIYLFIKVSSFYLHNFPRD